MDNNSQPSCSTSGHLNVCWQYGQSKQCRQRQEFLLSTAASSLNCATADNYVAARPLPNSSSNAKHLTKFSTISKIFLGLTLILLSSESILTDGLLICLSPLLYTELLRTRKEVAARVVILVGLVAILVALVDSSVASSVSKDGLVVVLATPQIPDQWQKCELNRCKNDGLCFQDGVAEFCVCSEGYGGKQCERMIDAIFFLDQSINPATLIGICKLAIALFLLAFLAALAGWVCCCLKHLNARRLYLNNLSINASHLRLARENSELRECNQQHTARRQHLIMGLKKAMALHQEDKENSLESNNINLYRQVQKLYIEARSVQGQSTHNVIKLDDKNKYELPKVMVIEAVGKEEDEFSKGRVEETRERLLEEGRL